jgi:hypothetical protein
MDLSEIEEVASERVLAAVRRIHSDAADDIRLGLEEMVTLTKRTEEVCEVLAELLEAGLLPKLCSFLGPEVLNAYPGEVTVRGLAVMPVSVSNGEAVQLAACSALGK